MVLTPLVRCWLFRHELFAVIYIVLQQTWTEGSRPTIQCIYTVWHSSLHGMSLVQVHVSEVFNNLLFCIDRLRSLITELKSITCYQQLGHIHGRVFDVKNCYIRSIPVICDIFTALSTVDGYSVFTHYWIFTEELNITVQLCPISYWHCIKVLLTVSELLLIGDVKLVFS